jgi:hypothetical protein
VGSALAVTLVATGFASHEMLRHLVQGTPVLAAALVAWRWPEFGRWALTPVFLFWLYFSLAIWFFLVGWPSPVTGHFNTAERICAGLLGVFPAIGFSLFFWQRRSVRFWLGLGVAALFGGAQIWAFILSTAPEIANR